MCISHCCLFNLLAPVSNMTKRNSSSADLDSPRDLRFDSWSQPMTTYRQRHASEAVASSAAAAASSSQGLRLPGTSSPYGSSPLNSYGYATSAPSVPMPTTHPTWHQPEHYIPITIAAVPKSEGTSHPTFQGGDHRPWSQPGSPIDGHGNRQHWSRKKP